MRRRCFAVFLPLAILGCADGVPDEPAAVVTDAGPRQTAPDACYALPEQRDDGLLVGRAADHGIDEAVLCDLIDAVEAGDYPTLDGLSIVVDGVLVFDEVFRDEVDPVFDFGINDDPAVHSLQSVTKSVASALVGRAIQLGHVGSVADPLLDHFPEHAHVADDEPRKADWTIEDFLTMQTGLDWDEWNYPHPDERNSLANLYQNEIDYTAAVLAWPMATEPGSTFAYCSGCSVALGELVQNATGEPLERFADDALFAPLKMDSALWVHTPTGLPHLGGGLLLSGRDAAKFGQLYLQDGMWDGERLLPEGWVEASSAPHVAFSGTSLGTGYGYQWWVDAYTFDGQNAGIYSAKGYGEQHVFVWPEADAVVVTLGSNWEGFPSADPMQTHLVEALGAR